VSQAIGHFSEPRGEFTLVIEGKAKEEVEVTREYEIKLRELYQQGIGAKEAVLQLSRVSGLSRRKLYQAWLNLAKGD
jgi:16S rRNA (cytidine1402-2'-O)-methyltransferase